MASDEQFSLCWNNFHANMSAGFHGLLSRGDLVDVTLAAEGRLLQAHKLVLSVCSPYFQEMFKMNPTQHPIVFLKDVSHSALRDLLQFMYQGEVNVKQEELASFISTAEQLQVKGLTGNSNEESSTPSKPKPTSRPGPRSSQQRQSVMTKLETDLDSKPSSTPVAIKRPNRPSIASNNSSSSQSGPAKRKCVDPLEAGPSGSAKDEFVTIPDEDENNAVAPKMEPEFVNESMWDEDDDGTNNDETNFGEDDSNMEMTGFDSSATGDGNLTGTGEGGAVGDAQGSANKNVDLTNSEKTETVESDDDVIEVIRDEAPIEILSDGEELERELSQRMNLNTQPFDFTSPFEMDKVPSQIFNDPLATSTIDESVVPSLVASTSLLNSVDNVVDSLSNTIENFNVSDTNTQNLNINTNQLIENVDPANLNVNDNSEKNSQNNFNDNTESINVTDINVNETVESVNITDTKTNETTENIDVTDLNTNEKTLNVNINELSLNDDGIKNVADDIKPDNIGSNLNESSESINVTDHIPEIDMDAAKDEEEKNK